MNSLLRDSGPTLGPFHPRRILSGAEPDGAVPLHFLGRTEAVVRNAAARCTRYAIKSWPSELDETAEIVVSYDTRDGREVVFRPAHREWLIVMVVQHDAGRIRYYGGSVQIHHLVSAFREVVRA